MKLTEEQKQHLMARFSSGPEPEPPKDILPPDLSTVGNFMEILNELPELSHKARMASYYLAEGCGVDETAARTGLSNVYVKNLMRDPRVKMMVQLIRSGEIVEMIQEMSPYAILSNAAVKAAEMLAEKMVFGADDQVQIKAALSILDRTGHAKKDDSAQVVVNIGPEFAEAYARAKRESEAPEAEFTVLDKPAP